MRERKVFLTKQQSMFLRGIAILMVTVSHYAEWYGDVLQNETLQYALTRLGCYGVDIFFLVSGYGLVKSAGKKRIGGRFLWNRIKNTYLPYLLIVGMIEWYGGGILGADGWYRYLTGYNWWFIRNILLFYLLFFAVYRLADKPWVRMLLMAAALGSYSMWLVSQERAAFWYLSNFAFLAGMLLAQYERPLLKAASFCWPVQLILLGAGMIWAIKTGLAARTDLPALAVKIRNGLLANGIWTYSAVQLGGLSLCRGRAIEFLGSLSLELYLCHMFFFYRIVNRFTEWGRIWQGAAAFVLAVAVSWGISRLFGLLWKAADVKSS